MLGIRCNFAQGDGVVFQFEISPNPVLVREGRQAGLLEFQAQDSFLGAIGILHAGIARGAVGENDVHADRLRIRREIKECEIDPESGGKLLCCFV